MRKSLPDDDRRPDEDNGSDAIPATHLDLVECRGVADGLASKYEGRSIRFFGDSVPG